MVRQSERHSYHTTHKMIYAKKKINKLKESKSNNRTDLTVGKIMLYNNAP